MNNVDLEYASKKGIVVKNVAGYSTESVAQHTFAMFLSLLHSIEYYNLMLKIKNIRINNCLLILVQDIGNYKIKHGVL
jgi:lactate dehydrogenase-like 2-hydroxyacid dehydrogenase